MKLLAVAALGFSLSACNGGGSAAQFLKGLSVNVTQQGTDSFLNLNSTFNLGNVSLAEMQVNIMDPREHVVRGGIDFTQLPGGVGQITLTANASLMANGDPNLGQMLPNGKPIPLVLGAPAGEMMGVPVLTNSVLYLGGDTRTVAYVGVALGIKGFDSVMNQLQTPANIFFMGNFGANVMGVGGIYGSANPGQSGVAIFGKYTKNPGAMVSAKEMAMDQQINELNAQTARKLRKFFYGKKRTIEFY